MKHISVHYNQQSTEEELEHIDELMRELEKKDENITEDSIEILKGVIQNSNAYKFSLVECPTCHRQDCEPLMHSFICTDCNEHLVVIDRDAAFKYHVIHDDQPLSIGEMVYRTVDGWMSQNTMVADTYYDKEVELQSITDASLDIYIADLSSKTTPCWLEKHAINSIVINWENGEIYSLSCPKCGNQHMPYVHMLQCASCGTFFMPYVPVVMYPVLDKEEEDRETPCYVIRNRKGQMVLVAELDEDKNQIAGINATKVFGAEDIIEEHADIVYKIEFQ